MSSPAGGRERSVGRRVSIAAAWMVAFRWADRLIGLASIAILARMLTPADFGMVGYAMLVLGLLEVLSGVATDIELIRHRGAHHSYYSAAWTMNILRGFAVGLTLMALVLPAVKYFNEPALAPVMLAFVAIPVIGGFDNVGIVEFRKDLAFDREFRFLITVRLVRTIATVALAVSLRNYWALVAGAVIGTAFRVAWSYKVHPLRPHFNLSRVPEMFRFSRWMMLQNLALGIYEKVPGFLIGREWSSSLLAFFNAGKEIADLAASELRAPIRRALYPGLAQLSDRHDRLRDMLVESTGMLALLTIPIPLGIALVASDLIPLFLGAKWLPTVEILQPLCVAAAITGAGTNSRLVFLALGRSHLPAIAAVLRVVLLAAFLAVLGRAYGVVGVAYALAGVSCALLVVDYALTSRLLRIDVRRFVAVVWRPVAASILMSVVVIALRGQFAPASDLAQHAWSLARSAFAGAAVYVIGVLGLWLAAGRSDGAERRILSLIPGVRAR